MTTKPRTGVELLSAHVDTIAEEAAHLQRLLAVRAGADILDDIAAWCTGHQNGSGGSFLEVQFGINEGLWDVHVFLGLAYRHHRAHRAEDLNVLRTRAPKLADAAVAMLKMLDDVAPAP